MTPLDYAVVAIYLGAIVLIGLLLQRRASQGIDSYFLGNRRLPWWVLGASGMASNTDVAGTMINTALIYALGTKGFFIETRGGMVLIMAFLMVYMGKWNRRSQAMTQAEWMVLRFGRGRAGNVARILSALSAIIFTVAMITFFAKGAGKFVGELLGMDPDLAALLMIALATLYTAASGMYGVVWTDVMQGVLIFGTILFICYTAMNLVTLPEEIVVSVPLGDGQFQTIKTTLAEWSRITPPARVDLPGEYSIYNLFGLSLLFYLFKVTLEGSGGSNGYMLQRYFAARSDRDAGLLSLFWTCLLAFRWPLIASFAVLGIYHGTSQPDALIQDPELVLPTVVREYIPIGVKGLLVAGLMAAAMSTFDSTVNAGAAYWVKDIYQAYLNPQASERTLLLHSRFATIAMVLVGLLFSLTINNINEIWGWITMGVSAGMFIPLVLRWYWARFNGYGFAIGTAAGLIAAVLTKLLGSGLPEYTSFMIASGASLIGCVMGALLTVPTDQAVLDEFYRTTRPFGFWGGVRQNLAPATRSQIDAENHRDLIALLFAVPWQIVLFLTGMMVILKQWHSFGTLLLLLVLLSAGLYWFWFRHLSHEEAL